MKNSTPLRTHVEQINGHYDPEYQPLYDQFLANFTEFNETGAAICVYRNGKQVVNLFGSHHSLNGPWQQDSRVCTMSCSKAPLALCIHILMERGLLSIDDPVAKHWPAFASCGKEAITIKHILNHTSGLPIITHCKNGDIFHWERMIKAIEKSSPIHTPGEKIIYHALTFGHLIGELIRRVDGRMPADFFHEEISQPYDLDYDLRHFPDQKIRSIAPHPNFRAIALQVFCKLPYLIPSWKMQYFKPCSKHYHPNAQQWQQSEIPAVTGQGSAAGLARLYAFLAGNGKLGEQTLCTPETIQRLSSVSKEGIESTSNCHWRMGLGFMLNSPEFVSFGDNPNSFGHMGMGGAIGFTDPKQKLAFAYVTEKYHHPNKRDKSMAGNRLQNLIKSCYQSLNVIEQ